MRALFLAKMPLVDAHAAEESIALTARKWLLNYVLANHAVKVLIKGRLGLSPVNVALLLR